MHELLEPRGRSIAVGIGLACQLTKALVLLRIGHGHDLSFGHAEDAGERCGRDNAIEHAHVTIGIDVEVAISATR